MKHDILLENDKLSVDSGVYQVKSQTYELFSCAEDSPDKVTKFLIPLVKNRTVLDFGCGTGKFIKKIAPLVNFYWAIEFIRRKLKSQNIDVFALNINDYLWTMGRNAKTPFHLTRTASY